MAEQIDRLIDRIMHRRFLRRWARAADAAASIEVENLRALRARARQIGRELDRLVHVADGRLNGPVPGQATIAAPPGSEWSWRPQLWSGPVRPAGGAALETRTKLGDELTLFHDCQRSEIVLRQQRNRRAADGAAYGLQLEVFHFDGSFLSLVLDLPEAGLHGMQLRHLVWLKLRLAQERPVEIFARLNIKHGPNTEQLVRELPRTEGEVTVEFDLAYSRLNEKRVERAWLDLIFGAPQASRLCIHDLALGRRPRADL